jgi:hypothetical protein
MSQERTGSHGDVRYAIEPIELGARGVSILDRETEADPFKKGGIE